MTTRRRRPEPGSRFRRSGSVPTRVDRSQKKINRSSRNPFLAGLGFTLIAAGFLFFFFSTQQSPITFGFDRSEFVERWNAAATDADEPGLFIPEVVWTDEDAGVFGFAFSDSTSVIGRVDRTPLQDVEELALVGEPELDGEPFIIAGMELVIEVTEPELSRNERAALLEDLAVLGSLPADPDQRTSAGTTEFRVAADPQGGVLGIGARPVGFSD